MKIAIPVSEGRADAPVDDRFGRCPFYCFFDTQSRECEFNKDDFMTAAGGAGPQVAELLAKNKISEVYAREIGPKAQNILLAAHSSQLAAF